MTGREREPACARISPPFPRFIGGALCSWGTDGVANSKEEGRSGLGSSAMSNFAMLLAMTSFQDGRLSRIPPWVRAGPKTMFC